MMIIVTYHGKKLEIPLQEHTTLYDVKMSICDAMNSQQQQQQQHDMDVDNNDDDDEDMKHTEVDSTLSILQPYEIKLLYKGKVLPDDELHLYDYLVNKNANARQEIYKMIAMGVSVSEQQKQEQQRIMYEKKMKVIVRDDLSNHGRQQLQRKEKLGRKMLQKATVRDQQKTISERRYGFEKIEVLPNLPNQQRAYEILQQLANDPGILACMNQHQWNVGILCELYPDGNVGQSPVCVMGYNENHGQKITLRLRTDDLLSFRPILSIKQVLYHELAHNVYSEHDTNFFQLMRQIEKECQQYDWTKGSGLSNDTYHNHEEEYDYTGGSYRLGGGNDGTDDVTHHHTHDDPKHRRRELAAQAAERRLMTLQEANVIEQNCGCSLRNKNMFLPSSTESSSSTSQHPQQQENNKNNSTS